MYIPGIRRSLLRINRTNISSASLKKFVTRPHMSSFEASSTKSLGATIASIEERIQRDEGNRGIKQICLPSGELLHAAVSIFNATNVVVLTGFPCLLDFSIPTETDGPPGAVAITKSLLSMGKKVRMLIDECNEDVLLACASAMDVPMDLRMNLEMQSFPAECDEKDVERLIDAYEGVDLIISIERAGANEEGKYLTMRGRDMTSLIAPLDLILRQPTEGEKIRSIGIGDGGNEMGMGKVLDRIKNSTIPNAQSIACATVADDLIVASVSNWGGYALSAAALTVHCTLKHHNFQQGPEAWADSSIMEEIAQLSLPPIDLLQASIASGMPSVEEEVLKLQRMIDAGARDGITRDAALMVDGMPLQASLDVMTEICDLVCT